MSFEKRFGVVQHGATRMQIKEIPQREAVATVNAGGWAGRHLRDSWTALGVGTSANITSHASNETGLEASDKAGFPLSGFAKG